MSCDTRLSAVCPPQMVKANTSSSLENNKQTFLYEIKLLTVFQSFSKALTESLGMDNISENYREKEDPTEEPHFEVTPTQKIPIESIQCGQLVLSETEGDYRYVDSFFLSV